MLPDPPPMDDGDATDVVGDLGVLDDYISGGQAQADWLKQTGENERRLHQPSGYQPSARRTTPQRPQRINVGSVIDKLIKKDASQP